MIVVENIVSENFMMVTKCEAAIGKLLFGVSLHWAVGCREFGSGTAILITEIAY